MKITREELQQIVKEELEAVIGEKKGSKRQRKKKGIDGKACWKGHRYDGTEDGEDKCVKMKEEVTDEEEEELEDITGELENASKMHKGQADRIDDILKEDELEEKKKKKKACKPTKGKRYAERGSDGKCRSYGQAGKSKKGGDRIQPGTAKGHAYCARSAKIPKCDDPPCPNDLSRKKWHCKGKRSDPD